MATREIEQELDWDSRGPGYSLSPVICPLRIFLKNEQLGCILQGSEIQCDLDLWLGNLSSFQFYDIKKTG